MDHAYALGEIEREFSDDSKTIEKARKLYANAQGWQSEHEIRPGDRNVEGKYHMAWDAFESFVDESMDIANDRIAGCVLCF